MAAEPEEETISERLRGLSFVLAAAYATLGAVLFFMPGWAAGRFAWNVSPFVAMTIGGWCLGTAWACFVVGRRGTWPALVCPILYLALFGLFESAVLVAFRGRLLIGQPLAWLYCATLAATCVFAVMAAFEAMGRRRIVIAVGQPLSSIAVGLALVFILLVGFLGLYGLLAVAGMRGLNGGIFPEQLSPFSLRAFGAFYLSLALAVTPMLIARGTGNLVSHGFAMYGLLVFITAAASVFIDRFDFAARPTQLIYIGIYLLVAGAVGVYLLRYGTGGRSQADNATRS